MFTPMNPMSERIRIRNERQLRDHPAASIALPNLNGITNRIKSLLNRRPAQPQTQRNLGRPCTDQA